MNFKDTEIDDIVDQMNMRLHPAHREITSEEVATLVEFHLGEPEVEAKAVASGPAGFANVGAAA